MKQLSVSAQNAVSSLLLKDCLITDEGEMSFSDNERSQNYQISDPFNLHIYSLTRRELAFIFP